MLAAEIVERDMYHVMLELNNQAMNDENAAVGLRRAIEILKGEPAHA